MSMDALSPLPVAVPLAVAAVLLAISKKLPGRAPDVLGHCGRGGDVRDLHHARAGQPRSRGRSPTGSASGT